MQITAEDRDILAGAIDSLGVALSCHDHQWTEGERAIYEEACAILQQQTHADCETGRGDDEDDDEPDSGDNWKMNPT